MSKRKLQRQRKEIVTIVNHPKWRFLAKMFVKFNFISISFKLHRFATPLRFMGQWMNSNNCREVIDQAFVTEICQRSTFDGKKEIPH